MIEIKIPMEASGIKDATDIFAMAIERIQRVGGGRLVVPNGCFHLVELDLCDHLEIHLSEKTKLLFSNQLSEHSVVLSRWEGEQRQVYHPLIWGNKVTDVKITGQGCIDGQGQEWWQLFKQKSLDFPRPYLLAFDNCQDIQISEVTLMNSPAWTIHPLESHHIVIDHVIIRNPLDSPNTDGIDPESSTDVVIGNCDIDVGDDCIAIKAGTEVTAEKSPCQDIIVKHNILRHGHGAVVFGSEMSGGISNVEITNNHFENTDRGIRIKTRRGRGGYVKNIQINRTFMKNVLAPITINEFYCFSGNTADNYAEAKAQPVTSKTPEISGITVNDLTAQNVQSTAGFIYGLPEKPVKNLVIQNSRISLDESHAPQEPEMLMDSPKYSGAGFYLENTEDVSLINVKLQKIHTNFFVKNANNISLTLKNTVI